MFRSDGVGQVRMMSGSSHPYIRIQGHSVDFREVLYFPQSDWQENKLFKSLADNEAVKVSSQERNWASPKHLTMWQKFT